MRAFSQHTDLYHEHLLSTNTFVQYTFVQHRIIHNAEIRLVNGYWLIFYLSIATNHCRPIPPAGVGGFSTREIRSPCWHRTSRIAFQLRRLELYLSISQQPTTLHDISASLARCCNCYLTDTWSAWSWRCLAIAASLLPPVTANDPETTPQKRRPTGIRLWPATTVSSKYAYADDPTITHADGDWQVVEGIASKNMATVNEYLLTWKLKLSTIKTVSALGSLPPQQQGS